MRFHTLLTLACLPTALVAYNATAATEKDVHDSLVKLARKGEYAALEKKLSSDKTLTFLDMSSLRLEDKGCVAVARGFASHPKLQYVSLANNNFGSECSKELSKALKENKSLITLDISHNKHSSAHYYIAEAIQSPNLRIQTLNMREVARDFRGWVEFGQALQKNPHITSVDLRDNKFGVDGAKEIAKAIHNPALRQLKLGAHKIMSARLYDEGIKAIMEAVKGNTTLVHLDLTGSGMTLDKENVFEPLHGNKTLVELILNNNSISDTHAPYITNLIKSTGIKVLGLSRNNLGDSGLKTIVDAIIEADHLQALDISNISFSHESADTLKKLIEEGGLKMLNLGINNLKAEGVNKVLTTLQNNKTLEQIVIDLNFVNPLKLGGLSDMLQKNTHLNHLGLSRVMVDGIIGKILARGLKENKSVTSLEFLLPINIFEEGAKELVKSLDNIRMLSIYKGRIEKGAEMVLQKYAATRKDFDLILKDSDRN